MMATMRMVMAAILTVKLKKISCAKVVIIRTETSVSGNMNLTQQFTLKT
jgi:hypothetical protein